MGGWDGMGIVWIQGTEGRRVWRRVVKAGRGIDTVDETRRWRFGRGNGCSVTIGSISAPSTRGAGVVEEQLVGVLAL